MNFLSTLTIYIQSSYRMVWCRGNIHALIVLKFLPRRHQITTTVGDSRTRLSVAQRLPFFNPTASVMRIWLRLQSSLAVVRRRRQSQQQPARGLRERRFDDDDDDDDDDD
ncbi:hypothetical protein ACFE04_027717 [Oxalis oulophora]